ncbi:hypothetical protein BOX15_Mlig004991g1 [Macrostomum lignano]|uniref:Uncharacterized protein n=2 Tax=Macrostomum lignano TaxID=282301 RepID=A0A267EKL4_9PLAT|nr:hypothetical protein BOX15_Mlig004991g1 [Macrostomum lignano]
MASRGSALRPGTASRLKTAMRPETKGGSAVAAGANVRFEDRPITQQGLGGLKTGGKGLRRQHEDKSYYIGLLRSKINELASEIGQLKQSFETMEEESSSFVQYEKMAETLAGDIKALQGELADYNTLVDKLNTDQDVANIQMDCEELRGQNEREERELERVFSERKEAEAAVRSVEQELEQERRMADSLVQQMQPAQQRRYQQLKEENGQLAKQLESGQEELEELRRRRGHLEDELAPNPVKQEAVRLSEQLREAEERRDGLLEEARAAGNPQQERERLLAQVKEDNQEIGTMERQTREAVERLQMLQSEIRATEQDIEDVSGQRSQQYRELRKREEQMDEFLGSYDSTFSSEKAKLSELERQVVELLDFITRSMGRVSSLPSATDFRSMQDQLKFKANEKDKADATAANLTGGHVKVQQDLLKIDQLERKTTEEIESLKERIKAMQDELVRYGDIGGLMAESEAKRESLGKERAVLGRRREQMKRLSRSLSSAYETKKKELSENENHSQLSNLERKWQHHEQNNFVMNEFIASKTAESDTSLVSSKVLSLSQNLNSRLMQNAAKAQTLA